MSIFGKPLLSPVLLVDDEEDHIVLTKRLLRQAGANHPIIPFTNSEKALAFLRALADSPEAGLLTPGVMFLDIKMPGVHGFVLLKWARRQAHLDDMRIVMLSGSEEPADRLRATKLGADHYLVKFPAATVLAEIVTSEIESNA